MSYRSTVVTYTRVELSISQINLFTVRWSIWPNSFPYIKCEKRFLALFHFPPCTTYMSLNSSELSVLRIHNLDSCCDSLAEHMFEASTGDSILAPGEYQSQQFTEELRNYSIVFKTPTKKDVRKLWVQICRHWSEWPLDSNNQFFFLRHSTGQNPGTGTGNFFRSNSKSPVPGKIPVPGIFCSHSKSPVR